LTNIQLSTPTTTTHMQTYTTAVFFVQDDKGIWRTEPGPRKKLMDDAASYLADGVNVALFPEGEISANGKLLPIKYGFFKLAHRTGVPIVPIGMWGNADAWGCAKPVNGLNVPKKILGAADIHVRIGAPVLTDDGSTLDELVVKVAGELERLTKSLPNYPAES
jgi:1-acyl-sn-glycerol-3-phosphate acyltransferase